MAANGYPGSYDKGQEIFTIPTEDLVSKIFHAGTALSGDQLVTNGGRVLGVTALGKNVKEDQSIAYNILKNIGFENAEYRNDIGYRAIEREKQREKQREI